MYPARVVENNGAKETVDQAVRVDETMLTGKYLMENSLTICPREPDPMFPNKQVKDKEAVKKISTTNGPLLDMELE
ncbi:hypothetical protein KIN20_031486 [Parelaphostrongylus tenuis]|uniref:Uncharacterized protein n=1 Tax=Parelaphostrongylus tenuis TaxID=148309 RepID=A0AAD5R5R8_PARTN|nr:hypothetical protein KIN20_031486 [Parelaphostrongylus tenuis]